ncbi:MAG: hypothetical protein A2719_01110 [Candidatus Ryanbacteria bacterium RIFCSPHIGHO2_01_FULL_45_22]|uniref:Uncharacterized protein n=1 Tax=Candidatus Ryanbacteria bacterium RIFCSPHIGHO2_01_FULL_45_22 TaxID=1802114 RepID=A0A1G2G0C6_9BACT|nr:MAG: hypothetical protein A2719_01110 [Candidatus Ryanbacteria bacterium RIFCSPHIGHO2_01_FULL_45_22]
MSIENPKREENFSAEAEKTREDMMIRLDAYINSHNLSEEGREELVAKLKELHAKLEDVFKEIEKLDNK